MIFVCLKTKEISQEQEALYLQSENKIMKEATHTNFIVGRN